MVHQIWSLWPWLVLFSGWPDFGPSPSEGSGAPLRVSFAVRPWWAYRSSCSRGWSSILLNSLSSRQEESHTCGQCRVTTQFLIDIKSDLLLWPNFTGGVSKQFLYKYSHCFERWVGPNYLLLFLVSMAVSVLGCRVELLRFTPPFLGIG